MDYSFAVYENEKSLDIDVNSISVIFVLKGNVTVFKKNNFEIYKEHDFLLVKPYQLPKLIIYSKKIIVLSIDKLSFNRFSLAKAPKDLNEEKVYIEIIKSYLKSIISIYEKDNFNADINIIKLINYIRLSKKYKDYTFLKINPLVKEVIEYVDENYKKPLTVSLIAEEFYVNPSYLSRVFSESMNITLLAYIRKIKIFRLAANLVSTPYSYDLWRSYGYESYETYLKHFKMVFSISPSEFVKEYTKNSTYYDSIGDSTYHSIKRLLKEIENK